MSTKRASASRRTGSKRPSPILSTPLLALKLLCVSSGSEDLRPRLAMAFEELEELACDNRFKQPSNSGSTDDCRRR